MSVKDRRCIVCDTLCYGKYCWKHYTSNRYSNAKRAAVVRYKRRHG